MYTLSGVSAGAGVGAAPSLTISKVKNTNSTDEIFAYDVETEIDRFNKKSSRFAQKLLQIVNPAKDSVRDLLGATAGFITSADNKIEILELIKRGCSASMAARTVLFENLDNFFKIETDIKND
ncbi:MAG: hypothetical protein J6Z28_08390, partial [Succinivibrio sp.]|nr:hypothetical protein [Succinivibrio sp.]